MENITIRDIPSEEMTKLREELAQAYEAREIATLRANNADNQIFLLREQIKALIGAISAQRTYIEELQARLLEIEKP